MPDSIASVLLNYDLAKAEVRPIAAGWINPTWQVTSASGDRYILQQVNRIFPVEIHQDIEAVTAHLERKHLLTPHLVHSTAGELFVREDTAVWRLLTFIDGDSRTTVRTPEEATEAGRILARFHVALADLDYQFKGARTGVHDTPRHLQRLARALAEWKGHPRYAAVAPLGNEILRLAEQLPALPSLPVRIVHGDPKISNILFAHGSNKALCLIDLDTLARMPLPLELGDAFRSWCNPAGENSRCGDFSATIFTAAVEGYAEIAAALITRPEIDPILPGTLTICVELAARFCTDALREDYFGWDPGNFPSHSEHSEVRAAGQLAAALALQRQLAALGKIVAKTFRK